MNIIKRGTPPEDRKYTATCRRCKTEVEFLLRETEYHSDQRDGDYLQVACPVCLDPITVAVRS